MRLGKENVSINFVTFPRGEARNRRNECNKKNLLFVPSDINISVKFSLLF